MMEEQERLAKKLAKFESKYRNIDLDRLHEKVAFLTTRLDATERERLFMHKTLIELI